jgi:hypothetical protein
VRTRDSGLTKIMSVEGGVSETLRRIAAAVVDVVLPPT